MNSKTIKYHCINHPDRIGVVDVKGQYLCWQCYLPPEDYAAKFGKHTKAFRIAMIFLLLLPLSFRAAHAQSEIRNLKFFTAAWLSPICPDAEYTIQVPYGENASDPNRVMAAVDGSLWINNDPNIPWTETRWTGQYYYTVTAATADPNIKLHITRYDRHTAVDLMRINKYEDQIINLKDFSETEF